MVGIVGHRTHVDRPHVEQVRRVACGIGGTARETAGAVEQVDDAIRRQNAAQVDRRHRAGKACSRDCDRPALAKIVMSDPALGGVGRSRDDGFFRQDHF